MNKNRFPASTIYVGHSNLIDRLSCIVLFCRGHPFKCFDFHEIDLCKLFKGGGVGFKMQQHFISAICFECFLM